MTKKNRELYELSLSVVKAHDVAVNAFDVLKQLPYGVVAKGYATVKRIERLLLAAAADKKVIVVWKTAEPVHFTTF